MEKKIVRYSAVLGEIELDKSAVVLPVDHPDTERVSNRDFATTSRVVRVGVNGEFETLNTTYRKA
jgi:hypothetical protein